MNSPSTGYIIVNGQVADEPKRINVHESVAIGEKSLKVFPESLPGGGGVPQTNKNKFEPCKN